MKPTYTRRQLLGTAGALLVVPREASAATGKSMRGAFPIMATPYTESKGVDFEDLAKEVTFLDNCGAHGMVWPQFGSEFAELTKDERMKGMEVLTKAAKGKKPALILGVQDPKSETAFEYAERAEKLGPDGMISMPPKEAKSLDDYRTYFRTMAKITKRPFFIQTSGGAKEVAPTVELLVELAQEFPNFGYIKAEYPPVIERIQKLNNNKPPIRSVMCGFNGRSFTYEMRLGTDGTCPYAHCADIFAQVWDLHVAGKGRESLDLYSKLLLMINLEGVVKGARQYLMKRRGVFKTTVSRQREVNLSPSEIQEIEANFAVLRPYLRG
jgi:dihydrodipicolinate synthase/N-acetylneuraminate lyase